MGKEKLGSDEEEYFSVNRPGKKSGKRTKEKPRRSKIGVSLPRGIAFVSPADAEADLARVGIRLEDPSENGKGRKSAKHLPKGGWPKHSPQAEQPTIIGNDISPLENSPPDTGVADPLGWTPRRGIARIPDTSVVIPIPETATTPIAHETKPDEVESDEPLFLTKEQWIKIGKRISELFARLEIPLDSTSITWELRRRGEENTIKFQGCPDDTFEDCEIVDLVFSGNTRRKLREQGIIEEEEIHTLVELRANYPQVREIIIDGLEGAIDREKMPEIFQKANRILEMAPDGDLRDVAVALEFDAETLAKDIKDNEGIVSASGMLLLNLADDEARLVGFMTNANTFAELRKALAQYEESAKTTEREAQAVKDGEMRELKEKLQKERQSQELSALIDLRKRYDEGTQFIDLFPGDMSIDEREALILKARRVLKKLPDRNLRGIKFILQSGLGKDFSSAIGKSGRIIVNLDETEEALHAFVKSATQKIRDGRKAKKSAPQATKEENIVE